jgi:ABC-type nitrate/sulfonate/bicarbonate transport system substrate-binding protein
MELRKLILAAMTVAMPLLLTRPALTAQERDITYALPSTSLVASPPRIAQELGLFAKYGIHPKFAYIDSTSGTATALLSGSTELAVTGTSEALAAAARGQYLVILASHYSGLAGSLVLSKSLVQKFGIPPEAPTVERVKALNNVIIASTSKISSFTIAYKGLANSVGADPRFSYMAVGAMGAALQSGAVDGIIVTAPYWTYPVLKGDGVLWLMPARGDLPPQFMPSSASVTATTREFALANSGLVNSVTAVFAELSTAFADEPAEVKAAIAKLYPELNPETLNLIFSLEAKAFETGPLTQTDIVHDIEFMKRSGMELGPIEKVNTADLLVHH